MSAPEIKEKITSLINNIEDEELLQEIYHMISEDSMSYHLSESQRSSVIKAKEEVSQGMSHTHDEVKKRTVEWLEK